MEGDTFISFTLDNEGGYGDVFGRPIGNVCEAVIIEGISQTDPIRPSHDVLNCVRGLPACQLFRSKSYAKLFREVDHRTFEGHTSDIVTLGCRENRDEPSEA